ncbi:hypothetical protein [Chromobacterium violaceum]|uniref:hypothetical protein n=1 Tax=Chromobacterium violaceum TaxID=536 RepID=UPI001595F3BE|nr:hypothetical protein [Chromobacterium violaceum]
MMTNDAQNDVFIVTEKGFESLIIIRARQKCEARINQFYPIWMQMNILRNGSDEDRKRMGDFIDQCRNWSNGNAPVVADLEEIQP